MSDQSTCSKRNDAGSKARRRYAAQVSNDRIISVGPGVDAAAGLLRRWFERAILSGTPRAAFAEVPLSDDAQPPVNLTIERDETSPSPLPARRGRPSTAAGTLGRHRVRAAIERMILTGDLAPKQKLVQLELARKFGVAQSVVREALLELLSSGLVRSVDNVGMHVCDMHPGWLVHAYEIRELFEGLAAKTCCETATAAEIREMYSLVERNFELGQRGLADQRAQSDRDFHGRIILASRNELLANLTDSCRALGMAVRNLRDLGLVYEEHRSIVRAIEDRRPQKAERAARDHIRAAREAIEESIRDGTFSTQWVLPETDGI